MIKGSGLIDVNGKPIKSDADKYIERWKAFRTWLIVTINQLMSEEDRLRKPAEPGQRQTPLKDRKDRLRDLGIAISAHQIAFNATTSLQTGKVDAAAYLEQHKDAVSVLKARGLVEL